MHDLVTPLHVRSGYSLGRGTALPEKLIHRARQRGHARLALTDVNNLYAATMLHRLAEQAHLEPILGAELREDGRAAVALAAGEGGYENLCRIITRIQSRQAAAPARRDSAAGGLGRAAQTQAPQGPPALARDLAELGEGLHLIVEEPDFAAALLEAGADRGQLWLEIDPATQSHSHLRRLCECAGRLGLPPVATGKSLFTDEEDYDVVHLLTAIRLGQTFDDVAPEALPPRRACLRSAGELSRELAAFPAAVANNRRLAERCRYKLLPRSPVFPGFACPDGLRAEAYLRRLCREGLRRRYGTIPPEIAECRLEKELNLISRLGFAEYFLVVWDIVQYARREGDPVAGRGSGASSLVAYVLGITNVCPLSFQIPFERFLHEGREDFPDLDIDFCWRVRDEIIEYAFRRWGGEHVAMVSTHNTYQPRSALRETAKAFGYSDEQISRMFKTGDLPAEDQAGALPRIARLYKRILELPHHLSVHPGGIVIGRKPIDHYVPLQPAPKGVMITQYDKDGIEDIRLVKLDLLGNRCLSTVRYACDLLRRRRGKLVDIEAIPPADPATIRTLRSAETVGCNQLESPAMRSLLKMMAPADVRDVMKVLALIRPGAASTCLLSDRKGGRQVGMKEVFVRRHRGREAVPKGHAQADAILADTYGVMLYEDDVMLLAAALLGCPLAEADRFRKAVQNCRDDAQRIALSRQFLGRCRENSIDPDYAKDLWVQMAKFNAYSFCRAHAASYAQLAYAGAYLKTHYPLEFWTAALNNNQSMYHPRVYIEQAKRAGIRFLLPDVNRSGEEFTLEQGAIRVGLNFVAGLGPVSVQTILKARAGGPFAGLSDFLARTRSAGDGPAGRLGREEARALVLCGTFDFTGRTRPALMMELDLFFGVGPRLDASGAALLACQPSLPEAPGNYTPRRKYLDERRILGISVRQHILELYRPRLKAMVDADSRDLPRRVGRKVRIAGVVEAMREIATAGSFRSQPSSPDAPARTGRSMMFVTLDDEYGLFEVSILPGRLHRGASRGGPRRMPALHRYGPYIVTGRVEQQYDAITLSAEAVELYNSAPARTAP